MTYFVQLLRWQWARLQAVHERDRERGSVTLEQILVAAGLATIALAVMGILYTRITGSADQIPTGTEGGAVPTP